MDFNIYQVLASRTANKDVEFDQQLLNYTLGLTGESGEFAEMVKKYVFHGHPFDHQAAAKELGDCLWYLSQLADVMGFHLEEIAQMNIEKLMTRYPARFNTEDSLRRVDVESGL